jgi:hypothetical protein
MRWRNNVSQNHLFHTYVWLSSAPIFRPRPSSLAQSTRIIERLNEVKDDLAKYGMLRALQDRNEVLFYHVLSKHVRDSASSPLASTAFTLFVLVPPCLCARSFATPLISRIDRAVPAHSHWLHFLFSFLPICTICTIYTHHQIEEFAKIIYTPVVGRACQSFAHIFRRTRGMYFSSNDRDNMASMVYNWPVRAENGLMFFFVFIHQRFS